MVCSLKCFCDFLKANTPERRAAVVKRYKKSSTGPAKGMMVYYLPALRLIKGKLCRDGSLEEKLTALRDACVLPSWPDKLNDARIASNTRVYKAFRSEFGNKKLKIFSSPRMQFLPSTTVAVNVQPELHVEVDGVAMIWKFGLSKDAYPEHIVHSILQMLAQASQLKGLKIPVHSIRFFDTWTGKTYRQESMSTVIEEELRKTAEDLAKAWEAAA